MPLAASARATKRRPDEALQAMRMRQTTEEFRNSYAPRAGIESTHAQARPPQWIAPHTLSGSRHARRNHAFRAVMASDHAHVLRVARSVLEELRLGVDIPVIQPRSASESRLVALRTDVEQPVSVRVGKRQQQHALDHREDRRVGSHAERQGENSEQRQCGSLAQLPHCIAQVVV